MVLNMLPYAVHRVLETQFLAFRIWGSGFTALNLAQWHAFGGDEVSLQGPTKTP